MNESLKHLLVSFLHNNFLTSIGSLNPIKKNWNELTSSFGELWVQARLLNVLFQLNPVRGMTISYTSWSFDFMHPETRIVVFQRNIGFISTQRWKHQSVLKLDIVNTVITLQWLLCADVSLRCILSTPLEIYDILKWTKCHRGLTKFVVYWRVFDILNYISG